MFCRRELELAPFPFLHAALSSANSDADRSTTHTTTSSIFISHTIFASILLAAPRPPPVTSYSHLLAQLDRRFTIQHPPHIHTSSHTHRHTDTHTLCLDHSARLDCYTSAHSSHQNSSIPCSSAPASSSSAPAAQASHEQLSVEIAHLPASRSFASDAPSFLCQRFSAAPQLVTVPSITITGHVLSPQSSFTR